PMVLLVALSRARSCRMSIIFSLGTRFWGFFTTSSAQPRIINSPKKIIVFFMVSSIEPESFGPLLGGKVPMVIGQMPVDKGTDNLGTKGGPFKGGPTAFIEDI